MNEIMEIPPKTRFKIKGYSEEFCSKKEALRFLELRKKYNIKKLKNDKKRMEKQVKVLEKKIDEIDDLLMDMGIY